MTDGLPGDEGKENNSETDCRDKADLLIALGQVALDNEKELFWEPCDCGCPGGHSPKSKASVDAIRIIKCIKDLTDG